MEKGDHAPLLPGAKIGILGGGQLGKMMAQAAAQLGYRPMIYAPEQDAPARAIAPGMVAKWDDSEALTSFARQVDVIGFEFENIPHQSLDILARHRPVHPGSRVLALCRHRQKEKQFLCDADYPFAPYALVGSWHDLNRAHQELGPVLVLKTSEGGYDGKGQRVIKEGAEQREDFEAFLEAKGRELVAEQLQDFLCECSLILARSIHGEIKGFPLTYTEHRGGILRRAYAPLKIDPSLEKRALQIASAIAQDLDLVGVLAVELFYMRDGTFLVNELAPRPHNSGHWSLDGGGCSQFEQWVRCLCGLPLGETRPKYAVEMINIIGHEIDAWMQRLDEPLQFHFYGKPEVREGRKMGHINRHHSCASLAFPPQKSS